MQWLKSVCTKETYRYLSLPIRKQLVDQFSDPSIPESSFDVIFGAPSRQATIPTAPQATVEDKGHKVGMPEKKVAVAIVRKVLIPGFLRVAETLPVVGKMVTAIRDFYTLCDEFSDNSEALAELIVKVGDAVELLNEAVDMFTSSLRSPTAGERLADSIESVNTFIKQVKRQNIAINFMLSAEQDKEMTALAAALFECQLNLRTSLSTYLLKLKELEDIRGLLAYPEIFTADVRQHQLNFQEGSRGWMLSAVMEEWLLVPSTSRVFWIRGEAGMGKSAFAAHLIGVLDKKNLLLGCFFCRFGDQKRMSSAALVRSLAAQCACHLSEATSCFVDAFKKSDPAETDVNLLFDDLLKKPLHEATPLVSDKRDMAILIDALDEIGDTSSERQPLLRLLAMRLGELPIWVRVIVTSRPEVDILSSLKHFSPFEISENDPRHRKDIEMYVRAKLESCISVDELPAAVELFMERSEGRFVYVATVMEDLLSRNNSELELVDLENELPEGLSGKYREFFTRMRGEGTQFFDTFSSKLLRLLVGSLEPLSVRLAAQLLECEGGVTNRNLMRSINQLKAMFPVRIHTGEDCFVPFHKSVVDWLVSSDQSSDYNAEMNISYGADFYIAPFSAHALYAAQLWQQITDEWLTTGSVNCAPAGGSYFFRFVLRHLALGGMPDRALALCFRLRFLVMAVSVTGVPETRETILWLIEQLTGPSYAESRTQLKLLSQLLLLSLPALRDAETVSITFPTQIMGRSPPGVLKKHAMLQGLFNDAQNWTDIGGRPWLRPVRASLQPAGGANELTINALHVSSRMIDVLLCFFYSVLLFYIFCITIFL